MVLITGDGPRFCGGGDVKHFATQGDGLGHYLREITTPLHAAVSQLVRLDAPVVVAVHGSAAAREWASSARPISWSRRESTKFVMAYTGIGLTPDGSSSWFLPRLVGERRALELVLTNRVLTGRRWSGG